MLNTTVEFSKRRDIGQIVATAFEFIKTEWKKLGQLTLLYVIPFFILYAYAQVLIQMKMINAGSLLTETDSEKLLNEFGPLYVNFMLILLFNIFVQSLFMGAVYSYLQVYFQKGAGNFKVSDVSPLLFHNSLLALSANLVVALTTVLGLILCIVPGIIAANYLSLTAFILVHEKKGINNAMMRSMFLVKNHWWETLLINLTGIIIMWITSVVFSLPASLSGYTSGFLASGEGVAQALPLWYWLVIGFSLVASSVAGLASILFIVLQYFNLDKLFREQFPEQNKNL